MNHVRGKGGAGVEVTASQSVEVFGKTVLGRGRESPYLEPGPRGGYIELGNSLCRPRNGGGYGKDPFGAVVLTERAPPWSAQRLTSLLRGRLLKRTQLF